MGSKQKGQHSHRPQAVKSREQLQASRVLASPGGSGEVPWGLPGDEEAAG